MPNIRLKNDWRHAVVTIPVKFLRTQSADFVLGEVYRVLDTRLPNAIIALAGGRIVMEADPEATALLPKAVEADSPLLAEAIEGEV